jgi:DNA-binding NtrC family response regulator
MTVTRPPAEAPASILVVDDDETVADVLNHWLSAAGFEAAVAPDGETALVSLGRVLPDVVVLDLSLPGLGGLEVLVRIKSAMPRLPIIILTGTSDVETVVAAMQRGAHDFLTKPVDKQKLLSTVGRAVDHYRLSERVAELQRIDGGDGFPGIVGRSTAMRQLFRQMERVAASDVTVLVRGESGTGKELVARALHDHSARKKGPFVAINCAAIPESLQESELFGHEKGAFTGASARHSGRFEQAQGGTLFLDEIGEIAPSLQAKLLRVFQERRFHRVGGTQEVQVDVRIVAATHRDLLAEVEAGRFREDLYFRVAVFELEVPPLRDREGDLPVLVGHLLRDLEKKHHKPELVLEPQTLGLLATYGWPGNVRELQNALERAVVIAMDGVICPEDLPRRIAERRETRRPASAATGVDPGQGRGGVENPITAGTEVRDGDAREAHAEPPEGVGREAARTPTKMIELERQAIVQALADSRGNVSEACRLLGIPRTTMYRKLRRHGLRAEE